jgi:hypothetical protein
MQPYKTENMKTKTFTYLYAATSGSPAATLKPEAIHMHVAMPCPMKVPFKQLFTPFVERYNATHIDEPIHCPDILDCGSQDLEQMLQQAKCENCLPDIIVTGNYNLVFAQGFHARFLKTGLFEGVTPEPYLDAMPVHMRENLVRNHIGVLCFSSWSVVQDLTAGHASDDITSWEELLNPATEGSFTVHGHLDKAVFGLMYFLYDTFGEEGIRRYARKIVDIKHFSQIIKRFGSSDPNKTAFSILPDVAVAKIPSGKRVRILNLKEGKVLSPMMLAVKKSKRERCREILAVFESRGFRTLLQSGCILPDELDSERCHYAMPDFDLLSDGYSHLEKKFTPLYLGNLDIEEINRRAVPGGVCK